ncbi:MAG TPA: ATP-binding cassette domain-containing protein, partial [Holophagaceae bacterium]|nr:ATP-binding cassette domain-containing protein [Holophagaceae bacterium]
YLVLQSEAGLGTLVAFVQMSSAFLSAFLNLANAYLAFVVLRPQLAPAVEVLEVETRPRVLPALARPLTGPVLVEGVWFRYEPKGPWVLKDSELRVEPGQVKHVQGPSGCGKSTLLRLIAGLYEPDQGNISIGGRPPASASGSLIYLPQFVQIYGGSILENLKLLSGQASLDRLLETAEQTGLQELLDHLPMGLETILPPGGGSVSGGQRQLIALTAVMASQRPLLLLDEAMSNLDWLSQKRINHCAELVGKTIVYTSHEHTLRRERRVSVA